jgi:hypothetical protein
MQVDLIQIDSLMTTDFSVYDLIVVGPDTDRNAENGHARTWIDREHSDIAKAWNQPVLALGEGGMIFLGSLGLDIGFLNAVYVPTNVARSGTSGSVIVVDGSHPVWNTPSPLRELFPTIYTPPSGWVEIYLSAVANATDISVLGKAEGDSQYSTLIRQGRFVLWGYESGPEDMTDQGKDLFVNVIAYVLSLAEPAPVSTTIPGAEWDATFEHRFPPGFWSVGAHEYLFDIRCTFWDEPGTFTNTFRVSEDAELFYSDVYLRVNKVTDVLRSNALTEPLDAIHPSQRTVAQFTVQFPNFSAAASAATDCNILFSWDGHGSETLMALPPYQK